MRRGAIRDRAAAAIAAVLVAATFGWLLWLARPEWLPTGSGPDLVHHLALIAYIEQHSRLVHDVRLSEYLGEMIDYTPGVHLLASLAGAWLRTDGLHALDAVVAATVAVKAGFIFLIARRLMPSEHTRDAFGVAAVLLLLVPYVYSIGSFTEQSYLAQVVSELFAVAMWWALIVWDDRPSRGAALLFAIFGVGAFLTWPVWTGPLLLVFAAIALFQGFPRDGVRHEPGTYRPPVTTRISATVRSRKSRRRTCTASRGSGPSRPRRRANSRPDEYSKDTKQHDLFRAFRVFRALRGFGASSPW